jgi:hypothetical protein
MRIVTFCLGKLQSPASQTQATGNTDFPQKNFSTPTRYNNILNRFQKIKYAFSFLPSEVRGSEIHLRNGDKQG